MSYQADLSIHEGVDCANALADLVHCLADLTCDEMADRSYQEPGYKCPEDRIDLYCTRTWGGEL